jgi:hypothetical protein
MKINKVSRLFSVLIIFSCLFIFVSTSRADDDENERYEDDYQTVETINPVQIDSPAITPVLVPSTISNNVAPIKTMVINSPQIDNLAVLAALADSDQDGIPNLIDKYPGEDDFAYKLIDNNNNGIADELEILIK